MPPLPHFEEVYEHEGRYYLPIPGTDPVAYLIVLPADEFLARLS